MVKFRWQLFRESWENIFLGGTPWENLRWTWTCFWEGIEVTATEMDFFASVEVDHLFPWRRHHLSITPITRPSTWFPEGKPVLNNDRLIGCWVGKNPSETWWTSSIGMMNATQCSWENNPKMATSYHQPAFNWYDSMTNPVMVKSWREGLSDAWPLPHYNHLQPTNQPRDRPPVVWVWNYVCSVHLFFVLYHLWNSMDIYDRSAKTP